MIQATIMIFVTEGYCYKTKPICFVFFAGLFTCLSWYVQQFCLYVLPNIICYLTYSVGRHCVWLFGLLCVPVKWVYIFFFLLIFAIFDV